tara:strand:+ start:201 stop:596 length:396 start_codon:yes stop_codon:yes gene_type:complete
MKQVLCLITILFTINVYSSDNFVSFECSYDFDGRKFFNRFTVDMEEKVAEYALLRKDGSSIVELTNLKVIVAPSHITIIDPDSITSTHKISRKDLSYRRDRSGTLSGGIIVSGTETGSCKKIEIETAENLF